VESPALVDEDGPTWLAGWPADEWYEPLRSEPALFAEFAGLSDEPEAFIQFAESYGNLDWGELPDGRNGVPLIVWRAHHRLMGFAVRLWEAIKEERVEPLLGREISVAEPDRDMLPVMGHPVVARIVAPLGEAEYVAYHWSRGGRDDAPRDWPRECTIAYLERRNLSPRATAGAALAQFVTSHCRDLSVAMVATAAPKTPFRLTYQVDSLIDAMWLQLALAINGNREYRTCPVCGHWWDATEARSDKMTCSDRCRKRQQRAKLTNTKEDD
jgi:predicted nucleic acid-binding Zn ribbon protein